MFSQIRLPFLSTVVAILVTLGPAASAQNRPALVLENLGLKNTYRIVFESFDESNHFACGAFEILGDEDQRTVPHTRIPFAAELKPGDKNTVNLVIRCTAMLYFFPPADKKKPYPTLTWKLIGRKGDKPKLKALFWDYNSEKDKWTLSEMDFEKAAARR